MKTTFQVEIKDKLIRLTYGKLLGTVVIDNEHVAISLNGTRAIRAHSQDRIEKKVIAIVKDFIDFAGELCDDKPVNVFFKNLERRELFFYHFLFTPDGQIQAHKLPEEQFLELVMPEQTRGGERHHGWYIKPEIEAQDVVLWCYDPIDHLLVRAIPTEQGVALRVISETNDPRINSQEAFTSGTKPPVERLHEALRAYVDKYDMGSLPEPTADSPEAAVEAMKMALRMAKEAPVQKHVFDITGQGKLEIEAALICGFKMMKKENAPMESCEVYWADGELWLYTVSKGKGSATIATWERKTMEEIIDVFQTTILGEKASEHIAPNMLN